MVFLKKNGSAVHCSGALIHPELVISAGHCFTEFGPNSLPNPTKDDLEVYFGLDDVSIKFLPVTQKRKIKKIHFHQDYDWPAAYNDIAIVELSAAVELGMDFSLSGWKNQKSPFTDLIF